MSRFHKRYKFQCYFCKGVFLKAKRLRCLFCSKDCFKKYVSRERKTNQYKVIFIKQKEGTWKTQYEHRYIFEKYLGRKLKTTEHIHHINGKKRDNRIENLKLMDVHQHNSLTNKTDKAPIKKLKTKYLGIQRILNN